MNIQLPHQLINQNHQDQTLSMCDCLTYKGQLKILSNKSPRVKSLDSYFYHGLELVQSSKIPKQKIQTLKGIKQKSEKTPKLKMSQIRERIIGSSKIYHTAQPNQNQMIQTYKHNNRHLGQIKNNGQERTKRKFIQVTEVQKNYNTSPPLISGRTEKNSRQSTYASTHKVHPPQISKYYQAIQESSRRIKNLSEVHKIRNSSSSHSNQRFCMRNLSQLIVQREEIHQISSMTKTVSQMSVVSNPHIVLDQSQVQWTYQTGFKTQPNQYHHQY